VSTELAVTTLINVDPEFQELVGVLYGPDANVDEVWSDAFGIAKADKPQLSEAAQTEKTLKRAEMAADLLDRGLSAKEIKRIRLVATKKEPVSKLSLKPLGALKEGILTGWKGAEKQAAEALQAPPKTVAARAKSTGRAQAAGATIRHPLQAVSRKPAAGVAVAGAGAVAADRHHQKGKVAYEDAYYGKNEPDLVVEGEFTKFDEDKRLAFGWASVVKKDGLEVVDRQGDWISPEDLENAAYKYVLTSRVGGDMHKRNGEQPHHVSDLVESFVVTPEKIAKMGLPESTPIGWWVGFKVHDDDTWDLVKKKGRTGFSIHGRGKRAMHDLDGY
jgi:hypothetical protein